MFIKLLSDVTTTYTKTAKGGYSTALITYDDERGNKKEFKLVSFSNPKVFDTLKDAKAGSAFEITTGKNGDFIAWTAAEPAAGPAASATGGAATPSTYKAPTSNYETKEERALRQRLIVRQSSLSAAINTLAPGSKTALNPDEVEALAERYNAFVFAAPSLFDQPNDLPDIPF